MDSMLFVQTFNNTKHEYEITLEPGTVIEVCEEEDRAIPKIQYHVHHTPPAHYGISSFYIVASCVLDGSASPVLTGYLQKHAAVFTGVKLEGCCSYLQLIKIQELNDRFANEAVDVIGVVDRVEPSAVIQTRDGREVRFRLYPDSHWPMYDLQVCGHCAELRLAIDRDPDAKKCITSSRYSARMSVVFVAAAYEAEHQHP